jgi:hypothetical protein
MTIARQDDALSERTAWSIRGNPELLTKAAAVLFNRLARRENEPLPLPQTVIFHLAHLLDTVAVSMRRRDDLPHAVVSAVTEIAYSVRAQPGIASMSPPAEAPVPDALREGKAS